MTDSNLLYIYVEDYIPTIKKILGETTEQEGSSVDASFKNILSFVTSLGEGVSYDFEDECVLDLDIDFTKIDSTLFGKDLSNLGEISLTIDLDPTDTSTILDVTVNDFNYDGCTGDITLSIKTPTAAAIPGFTFESGIGTIDLASLPILTKVGIATTERKAYKMSGSLKAKATILGITAFGADADSTVNIALRVGEEVDENNLYTVDGYVCVKNKETTSEDGWNNKRFRTNRSTTYYINDTNAYVYQKEICEMDTRKNWFSSWKNSWVLDSARYDYFKLTQEQIIDDIMYYLVSYTLNCDELSQKIEEWTSGGTEATDPLDMIDYFQLMSDGLYQGKLTLFEVAGLSMSLYADIGYNTTDYLLESLHVYSNFNIVVADVNLDLNVTNQHIANVSGIQTEMNEYDNFISNWNSNGTTSALDFRDSKDNLSSSVFYSSSSPLF